MKKLLLSILLVFAFTLSFADGWRPGEMQVKIQVNSPEQAQQLYALKLNSDFYGPAYDHIIAYVIPKELEKIQDLGFEYEIQIEDLNKYNQNFWLTEDAYHTYQQIIDLADSLETNFPDICKKYIFGYSIENRQCAALKISDNVSTDEPEAEVMFDGGIHGNEVGCSENVIRFARDLCLKYGNDPTVTNLVDNREIWLYLMVNPDGRVHDTRYNANGVDLNRDWAYMWDGWGSSTGACSQIESKNLRDCMYNNQFVIHTTYHSGTEFISCPWSYRPDHCPDFDHIIQLAGVYSSSSGYANLEYGQGCTGMYPINGSSKDSNYGIQGSISWSMEISYSKHPPASQIMMYYNYNYPSMITMIEYSGYGLEGTVTDVNTGNPVTAVVFVNDYFPTYTDPTCGDYHKYVLPGTYSITIVANGYQTQTIDNIVVIANSATSTDFQLQPEDKQYVFKLSASQIPDNNNADEGNTPAVIGAPDNINYSIGKNGWCVLDMQYPVIDGPGFDIIVYEGDATPEGFTCYVGETIDGPWISLGTGNGTTEFDITTSGLPEAQFIKIKDDGDGSANVADAGFDLDAIEAMEPVSGVYLAMYEYVVDDSNGNNNGKIDPGETVDIIVTLKNNGDITAENIEGTISTTSPYLTIVTGNANFGNLAQGETGNGTFTVTADINTPAGQPAEIGLDVTSNGGTYTNSYQMNFVIGQIPVVIIDLDENHNSGPAMQAAIQANEIAVEYTTSFPAEMSIYTSAFVCLGIYSDNHVLSSSEGQVLADFLNNGGNVYMEGGDTWYYDPTTAVHSMFNINPKSDGTSDLGTILGQNGTFTEDMSFNYSGDNSWIDHISAISPAFDIFENQSPNYGTGVAYDAGTYRTIGCSHEFGGLDNGTSPSTKEELMEEYLDFFGVIPEPPPGISVQLKIFLEGPYFSGAMTPGLNMLGVLPLTQPYNTSPWNYYGTESVASIPNNDVIDWILIELRDAPDAVSANPSTIIARQAAFVLNNGSIVGLDGLSLLHFNNSIIQQLFVVVYHRNHLSILSANPLPLSGGAYIYDFTTGVDKVYGGMLGHKELEPGVWGLISGDGNADGEVNNNDKVDVWEAEIGNSGYYNGDFNMNHEVNNDDKESYWEPNAGKGSHIVE